MARRSSNRFYSAQRDVSLIANLLRVPYVYGVPKVWLAFEDRRRFHPDDIFRPAGTMSRRDYSGIIDAGRAGLVDRDRGFSRSVLRFAVPDKVMICARRGVRREVLFAKKRMRSGAGGTRSRNFYSGVSCKR